MLYSFIFSTFSVDKSLFRRYYDITEHEAEVIFLEKRFYSVSDLYNGVVPVGRSTVYRWVRRADFPKVVVGRKILIPIEAFNRWIDEQTQKRS